MSSRSLNKSVIGIFIVLAFAAFAYADCPRDLPPIGNSDDNLLGATGSIHAPLARHAEDMAAAAANYFFFGGGAPFRYHELQPDLMDMFHITGGDPPDRSDTFSTAICNERGECGTATVTGLWGDGDEVGIPIIDIGDGLGSIDWDVTLGTIATAYDITIDFQGVINTHIYNADWVRDEAIAAGGSVLFPNDYDPRLVLPSTVNPSPGDDDLRCRDSNGNLIGQDLADPVVGDDWDIQTYYDYWEEYLEGYEDYYGDGYYRVCRGDFSDPNNTGVICSSN